MHMPRVWAIVLRQFYLIRGSLTRVVPLFVWVAIDMVLWGFMTKYLNSVSTGMNFVPTLLGAVLLWDFCTRVMQGVTMAFFEDVWSRNFLNIFATPLTIFEYLAGLVLSSIATSSIGLAVMLLLATTGFGLSLFTYGLMLIPFLLLLFVFGISLGIAATGMVLRLGPASEWFVWPIPAVLSPLVGVFYPIATLPAWMRVISHALPPTYVFEGVRAVTAGRSFPVETLMIGAVLSLVFLVAACWFFNSMYRYGVRTGLVARYSAETVS